MAESLLDSHYEEKFEFPLWKLIKQRAIEKDISYAAASREVLPEYIKTIRYRDTEFEEAAVQERAKEMAELAKHKQGEK